jgi:hypothetical protein
VTEIRFWLGDWEHECCGDHRKVGDSITVDLSFQGAVDPTDQDDQVTSNGDGSMLLVGETTLAPRRGWLVTSDHMEFGIQSHKPAPRVICSGRLREERHGDPSGGPATGSVSGTITGIRWHEAIFEKDGDRNRRVGYESPVVVYDTEKFPGYPRPPLPGLTGLRDDAARGAVVGPITFRPAPLSDSGPSGWAFEFILCV